MNKVLADGAEKLTASAAEVLRRATRQGLSIATAESCTGGLLSSLLTDVEGLSGCFERGFAVYSNDAKADMLGVDRAAIERHGPVSGEVAAAMAMGALDHSPADIVIAITGFAGPAGPEDEEGLVHLEARSRTGARVRRECHFGKCGRDGTRQRAVQAALEMAGELLDEIETAGGAHEGKRPVRRTAIL